MLEININLLFTVINLLVLCVLVKLFLLKPIHKILDERQKLVEKTLADADAAKQEAERLAEEQRTFHEDMDQERAKAIEESSRSASAVYDQIVAGANEKARDIIKNAETQAQRHKEDVIRKTQSELRDLVITATAKVIGAQTDTGSGLYDRFLEEVDHSDGSDD